MRHSHPSRWLATLLMTCVAAGAAGLAAAANVTDVNAVPHLNEKDRGAYAKFLTTEHAGAFAVAENGAFGYSSKRESRMQATA